MPRPSMRRQKPAKQHFRTRAQAVTHYTPKAQPPAPAPAPAAPPAPSVKSSGKRTTVNVYAKTPRLPDFTGTPGIVVLAGGTLWITVTYNDFWKPFFNSWVGGGTAPLKTNIDGRLIIGGIVFLIIAAIMASISEEAGGVMILMILAMWLVFIVKGGGSGQLDKFFGWFNLPSSQGSITGGTASGSVTGGAAKPPTQVPSVGGPGDRLK